MRALLAAHLRGMRVQGRSADPVRSARHYFLVSAPEIRRAPEDALLVPQSFEAVHKLFDGTMGIHLRQRGRR
ncbi:hypothetical protein B0H19DRAFT_171076 [Mycena capillaripes]|nr:hypothetical protein B0H19DRAFT_171076 [Mycena capillaripes]